MTKQELKTPEQLVNIKVVGIGGGGINAINHMIDSGMQAVEFIVVDCDEQALLLSNAENKIQIGKNLIKGTGMISADSEFGQKAAKEARDILTAQFRGADMVFVVACMGGAVGTGAASIVAECARKVGALTIGVVTKPLESEEKCKMLNAEAGILNLRDSADTVIVIPNDSLLQYFDCDIDMQDAFRLGNDVLRKGVQGISDLIAVPGLINVNIDEMKKILSKTGFSLMGFGTAKGENSAEAAAEAAINCPLIAGAVDSTHEVIFNITGGKDMAFYDIPEAMNIITEAVDPYADILFGAIVDNKWRKMSYK